MRRLEVIFRVISLILLGSLLFFRVVPSRTSTRCIVWSWSQANSLSPPSIWPFRTAPIKNGPSPIFWPSFPSKRARKTRWICGQTEEGLSILTNHLVHIVRGGTRTQEYIGVGGGCSLLKHGSTAIKYQWTQSKHAQTIMEFSNGNMKCIPFRG